MTISMCAFFTAALSLLVASTNAASTIHQTRQKGLQYQKAVGRLPDAIEQDQEALTREDIIQQNGDNIPPASMPAVQSSEMQQVVPPMQAQQLLQAQAIQMQQMQQQLAQQQNELQRLQKNAKQQHDESTRQPQKPLQAVFDGGRHAQQAPRPQHKKHAPTHTAKKSLVGVNAQVMTKSEMESGSSGISKPKGWDQCLKFARFVKMQDVTGVELVRVWKSTCEPAVQSGRATERYKLMCNSLSGVVEPYAAQIDYDVEQLCDSVLAVFHDVTAVDVKSR